MLMPILRSQTAGRDPRAAAGAFLDQFLMLRVPDIEPADQHAHRRQVDRGAYTVGGDELARPGLADPRGLPVLPAKSEGWTVRHQRPSLNGRNSMRALRPGRAYWIGNAILPGAHLAWSRHAISCHFRFL